MTDLERDWDDLPVGPAPVHAILREARREAAAAARRRPTVRLQRSLAVVTALSGIAAAFVVGTLVTRPDAGAPGSPGVPGSAGGDGAPGGPDLAPAAFHGELQAPDSCDDLLDHYVDRGLDRVTRWGWGGGDNYRAVFPTEDAAAEPPAATSRSAISAAESTETGTTVQEAGVDELDAVKTDGEVLVRLRGAVLTTYDVTGAAVTELGRLDLGDLHDGELLLTGDRVVAVGNDGTPPSASAYPPSWDGAYVAPRSPQTRVLTVDVADPAAPALDQSVDYDAGLVAARQHGDDVRLVLSKGLPDLPFRPRGSLAAGRALVERTTLDDWLPHFSVDGGAPTDLLDCDRVAVPRADLGLATMAVVGFGSEAPGDVDALGLAGDAPLTYESADHLYLASTGSGDCADCFLRRSDGSEPGSDGTTHVYDFSLDATGATYAGAGEVEGTVRDRWSMDEADGVLRVAVGPSSETGDWNSIVTLRADGDRLVEAGRIDRLGVGEDIEAVRWFDGLALLVTFRRVDPLYAVDLTDVSRPALLGELKIPGFSTYLHPLGPRRFVGVGSGPQARGRSGAQAGLFDLTDVADPRRLDVTSYGSGTYARAGDDPRQLTWLRDQRVVLTVVARGRAGYVSRLQLGGGRMRNEMTRVEYGSDVDAVRLVPLPRGRVALVTGEDVRLFPLS